VQDARCDMRRLLAIALTATLGCTSAQAQDHAAGAITIMVGFAAGGPTDTLARILTERMRNSLGQPLIVENVPGATGTIAIGRVVRAAPDGRTLSMGNWTSHVGAPAIYPIAYDVLKDIEPVSLLPIAPLLIAARKTFPPNDIRELIAWLKANPGQATAAIVGFGSSGHVSLIDFEKKTDTRFQFVPYRGGGPAMNDLVAGQVDLRPTEASTALPYLASGKIKAYAVLAKTRWVAAPDIPTIDEAGVPGVHIALWNGLWAPKNTPRDVIARLNSAVVDTLADPVVRQRIADLGLDMPPREKLTPAALHAHHKAEIEKWWPIIKAAGITAQ
jgi:tripartite-type tricarboxylate transporter receptor subunit TctC